MFLLELPTKADDIRGTDEEELNANNATQIRIKQDGKWCEKVNCAVLAEYKAMLRKWYKGTEGSLVNSIMVQNWSEEKKDR